MNELLIEIPRDFDPKGLALTTWDGREAGICVGIDKDGDVWVCGDFDDDDTLDAAEVEDVTDAYVRKSLRLSLANSATRDRLARRVAERVGVAVGSAGPKWCHVGVGSFGWEITGERTDHDRGYYVFGGETYLGARTVNGWTYGQGWELVPALYTLDLRDDTRLPDGSRLVDALALGCVVRHLASVQP